jgi:hypothetical protein
MSLALQKLVLAIVLSTIVAFAAGVEAGRALATQLPTNADPAPALMIGTLTPDNSAPPSRCTSSLGPEDYETCKAQFGEP